MAQAASSTSSAALLDLLRRERFREVLRALEHGVPLGMEEVARLALQAEAYAGLAEFDVAVRLAQQALQMGPSARALTVLGNVALHDDRNPTLAVQRFGDALQVDADFAAAHEALGRLLLEAGYAERAAPHLRRAARLAPDNWRYAAGAALLEEPIARERGLRAAYRAGLAEHPGSPRLRLRLAGTYLKAPLARLVRPAARMDPRLGLAAYQRVLARSAILTYVLILANVAMYLVLETHGGSENDATLDRFGAKDDAAIVHGRQWWRLVTPLFLHAGPAHLATNMLSLYFIGVLYERCVGRGRFLYVYLFAGICGSLASLIFTPGLAVGASGAIFGLFGALGVYFYRNRALFGAIARSLLAQLLILGAINLVLPNVIANVDGWAHVGGLLGGIVAGILVGPLLPAPVASAVPQALLEERRSPIQVALWLALGVVVLLAFAVAIIAWNPLGA